MTRSTAVFGILLLLPLSLACSPHTVSEIDVKVGQEVSASVGYYAYFTDGESKTGDEVRVVVAGHDLILGAETVQASEPAKVYPRKRFSTERVYFEPNHLALATALAVSDTAPGDGYLEIGYFMRLVNGAKKSFYAFDDIEDSPAPGVKWGLPEDDLSEQIREALVECRKYAGRRGGDVLADVSVFWMDQTQDYGIPGVYLYGRVLARTD